MTGELYLTAAYRVETPMDVTLSTADAGLIARRGRKLLARGRITHRQYVLLDCLLWSCRAAGKATARVSYSQLQKMAHQARSTVAGSISVLIRLRLVQRIRYRLLVVGQNGGRVWRQLPNVYRLVACAESREFDERSDSQSPEITLINSTILNRAVEDAQQALKRITDARAAQRAAEWRQGLRSTSRVGLSIKAQGKLL